MRSQARIEALLTQYRNQLIIAQGALHAANDAQAALHAYGIGFGMTDVFVLMSVMIQTTLQYVDAQLDTPTEPVQNEGDIPF